MTRYLFPLALVLSFLFVAACTDDPSPAPTVEEDTYSDDQYVDEEEEEDLRDRASRVGAVGDATMTHDLQKNLTGLVDSAADHASELEEASSE